MENLKNGFFTNGFFSLGDEGEIDSNRFFKDRNELAKFVDNILDKYDDHPSLYYTVILLGILNRYFKRVNRSEHGRGTNELNNILEYEGENCYKPNGNGCFLKCMIYIFKKDFSMEFFEFIESYKRRTSFLTRCRIPEFCAKYTLNFGIYDPKSKRIVPRNVKQRHICVHIHKNHYCVIWKKNRRDALLNGVEKIERNFRYAKNSINEHN